MIGVKKMSRMSNFVFVENLQTKEDKEKYLDYGFSTGMYVAPYGDSAVCFYNWLRAERTEKVIELTPEERTALEWTVANGTPFLFFTNDWGVTAYETKDGMWSDRLKKPYPELKVIADGNWNHLFATDARKILKGIERWEL